MTIAVQRCVLMTLVQPFALEGGLGLGCQTVTPLSEAFHFLNQGLHVCEQASPAAPRLSQEG